MKYKKVMPWVLVAPAIAIFLGLGIFPLVYSLWLSFRSYSLVDPARGNNYVGLWNYANVLFKQGVVRISFLDSLRLTTIFLGASLSLEVIVGLGGALFFASSSSRVMQRVRILLVSPMLLAPVIVGYMWRYMYQYSFGVVNYILNSIALPSIEWLTHPTWAMVSLILADVWEWAPFSFLVLLAAILSVPGEQIESARIDGAGSWKTTTHIVLPWISKALLVVILLRGIELIKNMDLAYSITLGGPGVSTRLLSFCSYLLGFKHLEMGQAAAYSFLMLIPMNVFVVFLINTLRRGGK